MFVLAVVLAIAPVVVASYAYVAYPAVLWLASKFRRESTPSVSMADWPSVTVTLPVYNSAATIRHSLDGLLALDYPREKLQLLVLSDASNDGTDDMVREYAGFGVELLRAPTRRGKTAGENAAVAAARGDIIVNIDATVAVPPASLKALISAFGDPSVGVASGRDVSVGNEDNLSAESDYTGYEMMVRELETRLGSIVGASGCFYGIRRRIRNADLPAALSWDFASTLVARRQGFRSVSVPSAVCVVPRTCDVRFEFRRKARTMARGLSTLFYCRDLMNPLKYGGFAIMLISHKLSRWIPYLLLPVSVVALAVLAVGNGIAAAVLAAVGACVLLGAATIRFADSVTLKPFAVTGFALAAASAGVLAWIEALRGARLVTWDPTPRTSITVR